MRAPLVALLVTGCSMCEAVSTISESTETHVDLPSTVDAVRAWAPSGTTVDVRRVDRHTAGGGACGHSIVCIIVLPVILAEAIVPPLYDVATVKRGEEILYQGLFDLRGRVINARVRDGTRWRVIHRLPLDRLGAHPIVELERVAIEADGSDGAHTRVPIVPQVDLVTRYRAAIDAEDDADDRAALLGEALDWLKDEVVAYAIERAGTAAMDDEERSLVIAPASRLARDQRERVLDALASRPGPMQARAAFEESESVPASRGGPLAAAVGDALCAGPPRSEWEAVLHARGFADHIAVAIAHARACAQPARATFARALLGDAVDDRTVVAALAADPEAGSYARPIVIARRSVLFELLSEHPEVADSTVYRTAFQSDDMMRSYVTADEAEILARACVHERATRWERWRIGVWLGGSREQEGIAPRALAVWEPALAHAQGEVRAWLAAALYMVGREDHAAEALREIGEGGTLRYIDAIFQPSPTLSQSLAAPFLSRGCSEDQIREAARAARANQPVPRCGP